MGIGGLTQKHALLRCEDEPSSMAALPGACGTNPGAAYDPQRVLLIEGIVLDHLGWWQWMG